MRVGGIAIPVMMLYAPCIRHGGIEWAKDE